MPGSERLVELEGRGLTVGGYSDLLLDVIGGAEAGA